MKKIEKFRKRAIDYVQENKKYIIIVSIIYFILFMLYFIFFLFYPDQVPGEARILDAVGNRDLFLNTVNFSFIIENWWNKILLFFIILLFAFAFSIGAFLYILIDTSLFWLSLARFIQYDTIDKIYLVLAHQFFSLPIILLTLALSFKLTISLYKKTFKKGNIKIMQEIKGILKFYFMVIIPLFLLTYIVEILFIKYIL